MYENKGYNLQIHSFSLRQLNVDSGLMLSIFSPFSAWKCLWCVFSNVLKKWSLTFGILKMYGIKIRFYHFLLSLLIVNYNLFFVPRAIYSCKIAIIRNLWNTRGRPYSYKKIITCTVRRKVRTYSATQYINLTWPYVLSFLKLLKSGN